MNKELEELQQRVNDLLLKHEVHNEILALELVRLVIDQEEQVTNRIYSQVIKTVQEVDNAGS